MTPMEAALLRDMVLQGEAQLPTLDPHKMARTYVALRASRRDADREFTPAISVDRYFSDGAVGAHGSDILEPTGDQLTGFPRLG